MSEEYVPNRKRNKAGRKAPCAFEAWDGRKKKEVLRYPNVGCAQECETCGWNPEVKQRRLDRICRRETK